MKVLNDIFKDINEKEFFENQFKEIHWNKNILFINPQLNGRHLYKYLLPALYNHYNCTVLLHIANSNILFYIVYISSSIYLKIIIPCFNLIINFTYHSF